MRAWTVVLVVLALACGGKEAASQDVADNFVVAHARRQVSGCCFCTPTRNLQRAGRQPQQSTLETVKLPGISGCGFAPRGWHLPSLPPGQTFGQDLDCPTAIRVC